MKHADLSRYGDAQLETMLESYRRIAAEHGQASHYALAKWARGMCTHITVEMNTRWARREHERSQQLTLWANPEHRPVSGFHGAS